MKFIRKYEELPEEFRVFDIDREDERRAEMEKENFMFGLGCTPFAEDGHHEHVQFSSYMMF